MFQAKAQDAASSGGLERWPLDKREEAGRWSQREQDHVSRVYVGPLFRRAGAARLICC